jgi:hypothetical protein
MSEEQHRDRATSAARCRISGSKRDIHSSSAAAGGAAAAGGSRGPCRDDRDDIMGAQIMKQRRTDPVEGGSGGGGHSRGPVSRPTSSSTLRGGGRPFPAGASLSARSKTPSGVSRTKTSLGSHPSTSASAAAQTADADVATAAKASNAAAANVNTTASADRKGGGTVSSAGRFKTPTPIRSTTPGRLGLGSRHKTPTPGRPNTPGGQPSGRDTGSASGPASGSVRSGSAAKVRGHTPSQQRPASARYFTANDGAAAAAAAAEKPNTPASLAASVVRNRKSNPKQEELTQNIAIKIPITLSERLAAEAPLDFKPASAAFFGDDNDDDDGVGEIDIDITVGNMESSDEENTPPPKHIAHKNNNNSVPTPRGSGPASIHKSGGDRGSRGGNSSRGSSVFNRKSTEFEGNKILHNKLV